MANEQEELENQNEGVQETPQTDWKAQSRKWEKLAKSNADKAKAYDELAQTQKQSSEQLEAANARIAELETAAKKTQEQQEHEKVRNSIAKKFNLPADLIMGTNEDEMREFAQRLKEFATPNPAPQVPAAGSFDTSGTSDTDKAKLKLAQQMFSNSQE